MGALGSTKERLKTWYIILKNKRHQSNKKNKNRLITRITFTFLLYIFRTDRKKEYLEIKEEQTYRKELKDLKKLDVSIRKIKTSPTVTPQKIVAINQNIENMSSIKPVDKVSKRIVNKLDEIKREYENLIPSKLEQSDLKKGPEKAIEKENEKPLLKKDVKKINKTYIKKTTKKLKDITKEIDGLNAKIRTEDYYNALYDYEYKIKVIKNKLRELIEEYETLKKETDYPIDIKGIDIFGLLTSSKVMQELLKKSDTILESIENKRKQLNDNKTIKEEISKSNKKESDNKSTENKKVENKKEQEEDYEIIRAHEMINESIQKDLILIENIKVSPNKNSTLNYVNLLIRRTLIYAIETIPFLGFRNKILGALVSSMLLNNSIKTTRKLLNPDLEMEYMNFSNILSSNLNSLNNLSYICNNSLSEISSLREEMIKKYGINNPITNEYLAKIQEIEDNLYQKKVDIISASKSLKNKQKLIKWHK